MAKVRVGMVDSDSVSGFVYVDDFRGAATKIELNRLNALLEILKAFSKAGLRTVEIGIEEKQSLLIFLDENRTFALAIASISD